LTNGFGFREDGFAGKISLTNRKIMKMDFCLFKKKNWATQKMVDVEFYTITILRDYPNHPFFILALAGQATAF